MRKRIDLTGQRFGRLIAVSFAENDSWNQTTWNCLCDCGNYKIVRTGHLRRGFTISCGCYAKDKTSMRFKIHGLTNTPIFNVWKLMNQRCSKEYDKDYKKYGKRGIKVCEEWRDVSKFAEWSFQNGYKKGLTLDRVNNDGDYEPSNCRWATPKEQANNQRTNLMVGDTGLTLSQYCEENNINYNRAKSRVAYGNYKDLIPHTVYKRGIK